MSTDKEAYRDLVFETQALRRRVERDLRLGGALGVAGTLWPHQVANVARVLNDTSVRHVLADEVGLGKTVQAIMIIKALRLQRPDLRVGLLVPDPLQRQWLEELFVRGNLAVIEGEPPEGDDRRPVLLWPSARGLPAVKFEDFELLVVDELPRLTKALQDRVAAASPHIDSLIVLTATPPLDDPERAQQLFQLVEPVRAELAGGDPIQWLKSRERGVHKLLLQGWPEENNPSVPPDPRERNAALAYAATRRLLRTRREVWKNYLPHREPRIRLLEPTAAERSRQELLWRWLTFRGELPRDFDAPLMAQRVRSPASLRQRVTFLRGKGYDREGLIEAIGRTLDGDPGDTRFEGLVDVLTEIWEEDSAQPVLIAAGDNLTVDDLQKRLPAAFDAMPWTGEPLTVAKIRNQTSGPEALTDADPISEAARAFREGDAQVLLLAEAGSAGLNLQCARHIVLYSVPWDPSEVEQLIGRVDRIGNPATVDSDSNALPIVVHVMAQRGLVDHRVLEVIAATKLLSRSISIDGDAVEAVRQHILEVALRNDPSSWPGLIAEAKRLGSASEAEDLDLPLLEHLPTSPDHAYPFAKGVIGAPAAEPSMGNPPVGEGGWSVATLNWLKAMRTADKYFLVHQDRGAGVRRLAYKLPAAPVRSPADLDTRPFGSLRDIKSQIHFRTHRADLEPAPPMKIADGSGPLYFFDHGSPPHEDLARAWFQVSGGKKCTLVLGQDDPCAHLAGAAVHIQIGWLDAARLLPAADFSHPELEADRRFLRGLLPSTIVAAAVILRPHSQAVLSQDDLHGLLAPDPRSQRLKRAASPWIAPRWLTPDRPPEAEAACALAVEERARERWNSQWLALGPALEGRCYVLGIDAAYADELFSRRRANLEAEADVAQREGRAAAARASLRRIAELVESTKAREDLEACRDDWLAQVSEKGPMDAFAHFADAWLFLQR